MYFKKIFYRLKQMQYTTAVCSFTSNEPQTNKDIIATAGRKRICPKQLQLTRLVRGVCATETPNVLITSAILARKPKHCNNDT